MPSTQTSSSPPAPTEAATTATGEPFSLLTHCGISTAYFAGRDWVAVTPRPEPRDRADGTGVTVHDGHTTGTMTVISDDLVRFTVTDPTVEEIGLTVDFVPAAPPTSLCE